MKYWRFYINNGVSLIKQNMSDGVQERLHGHLLNSYKNSKQERKTGNVKYIWSLGLRWQNWFGGWLKKKIQKEIVEGYFCW